VKDQPEAELRIRAALGYVYMQTSLLPQAQKELRRAETLARQTRNNEMLASTLISLGNVLYDESQCRPVFMEALGIAKNKGNELSPNLRMGIFSEVGQRLGFEGHSPEVEQDLRNAVQIGRTNSVQRSDFAIALSRLGQYLRFEDRLNEAESLQNEALGLLSSRPVVSSDLALEELGAIRIKRGDLEGGERYYRERRDLLMRLAGPENGTTMDARSRWAGLQARRGHIAEALQEMRENMVHCRKAFAAGSFGLWHPLATLAYILNMADQPVEAWPVAKESLACFGRSTGSDLRFAMIEAEAGVSLAKLHRYGEAVPYLEDCYRIYSGYPGFGPKYYNAVRAREYLDSARAGLGGGARVSGPKK
jgi:tetratricopeptide (TPR) repeat protein